MQPTVTIGAFERPDPALLDPFRDKPSGNVSDAARRMTGVPAAIKPVTRAFRFCGAALTVDTGRGSNLGVWAAMEHVRPGDVLVIATHDSRERAVIGDLLAGFVFNAGAVAIVTDGMIRDAEELDAIGKPVFAAGITPVAPSKDGAVSVGLPVSLGTQRIAAGDVVVGDRDGIVVVPQSSLADAATALEEIAGREASMTAQVKAGATVPEQAASVLGKARIIRTG